MIKSIIYINSKVRSFFSSRIQRNYIKKSCYIKNSDHTSFNVQKITKCNSVNSSVCITWIISSAFLSSSSLNLSLAGWSLAWSSGVHRSYTSKLIVNLTSCQKSKNYKTLVPNTWKCKSIIWPNNYNFLIL